MKCARTVLVISVVGLVVALNTAQQAASQVSPEPAVRAALTRFLTAFENLDWDVFRASFDDDATAFFPSPEPPRRFEGRAAVEAQFRQVFSSIRAAAPSGPPFQQLAPEDLRIETIGTDAAIATFHLRNEQRLARRTIVFKHTARGWRIAHLHASNVSPALTPLAEAGGQPAASPEVVDVRSGALTLRAQVWRPSGSGPFPAVLFNHGSYSTDDPLPPSDPETLGPVFARHGYVFLWLHRQGTGLSSAQGVSDGDQMARALQAEGVEGRNRAQLQLLENEQMNEATAALARLRARGDVDARRIGVVGHSFGGSLSVLMAARDPEIRAAVIFGVAAGSWNQSAELRERLLAAVARMSASAFFIHAANDYSTAPGPALAAEMQRLARPHALKIYPPYGADPRAGHNLVFRSVRTWESDVFAFLDAHLRR
jgi:dienelactone hydrolase/ketosteroid isomerase-like protein